MPNVLTSYHFLPTTDKMRDTPILQRPKWSYLKLPCFDRTIFSSALTPALWPCVLNKFRAFAHLPFPSIIKPIWTGTLAWSKILSFTHVICIQDQWDILYSLHSYEVFETWCVSYTNSRFQFGPATLQMLNCHMRLVATILSGTTRHHFSTTVTQTLTHLHPFLCLH